MQEVIAKGVYQDLIHLPQGYNPSCDIADGTTRIKLKIFGGPSAGEVYYFQSPSPKPVSIGRAEECEVRINDKLLSKFQATVSYDVLTDSWYVCDGCNGKPSTNGTWLYLNEDYEMTEGMVFKANQTIFTVNLN